MHFAGAKLMLFLGEDLVVLRRDHKPGIPYPGMLDFPGGGREGDERPEDCARRETFEEVGLCIPEGALTWRRAHGESWFFAAHLPQDRIRDVVWGGEGEGWMMMPPDVFVARNDAIPHFREMLSAYLAGV